MRTRDEIMAELEQVGAAGRRMNRLQNEGGEGYDHTDMTQLNCCPLRRELNRLSDELEQAIRAEWTIDATIERRARWNAAVQSMARPTARAIERATGISLDELKAAVKRHSIA